MPETFSVYLSQARNWVSEDSVQFSLVASSEADKRLDFSAESKSFFVVCPSGINSRWHVWSDDPSSLSRLAQIQDYTDHCSRTLLQVLRRASELLFPKDSSDEEADEDGDDGIEDDVDGIYFGAEEDEEEPKETAAAKDEADEGSEEISADDFFTGDGSPSAVHRLIRDLKSLKKTCGEFGVEGEPADDNLFVWSVKLSKFEKGSLLFQDLETYAAKYKREPVIEIEMKFPKDYPMSPPFVRIIRPRFKFLTGHVTLGGSVCMELLTKSGWRPTIDIESVLIQIRAEILSDKKARLEFAHGDRPYDETEAKRAFQRMVMRYGWNQ